MPKRSHIFNIFNMELSSSCSNEKFSAKFITREVAWNLENVIHVSLNFHQFEFCTKIQILLSLNQILFLQNQKKCFLLPPPLQLHFIKFSSKTLRNTKFTIYYPELSRILDPGLWIAIVQNTLCNEDPEECGWAVNLGEYALRGGYVGGTVFSASFEIFQKTAKRATLFGLVWTSEHESSVTKRMHRFSFICCNFTKVVFFWKIAVILHTMQVLFFGHLKGILSRISSNFVKKIMCGILHIEFVLHFRLVWFA